MGLLNGKVALITGAARGIGKAIALKYASEGADVAFTDLVINEAAEQTIKELEAFGHKVKGYASNAADFEQTKQVVDQVMADFGRIDILVNNAGITKDGLMLRMTEAQWDAVINVNLKSRRKPCRLRRAGRRSLRSVQDRTGSPNFPFPGWLHRPFLRRLERPSCDGIPEQSQQE